ncbi:MAG: hypothetical protein WBK54_02945 [Bacilli bacterium]
MIHYLKNRWQLEKNCLHYYGLRNKENLFKTKSLFPKSKARSSPSFQKFWIGKKKRFWKNCSENKLF